MAIGAGFMLMSDRHQAMSMGAYGRTEVRTPRCFRHPLLVTQAAARDEGVRGLLRREAGSCNLMKGCLEPSMLLGIY